MMQRKKIFLGSALAGWVSTMVLLAAGYWLAAIVVVVALSFVMNLYWPRLSRQGRHHDAEPLVLGFNQFGFGIGLLLLGLLGLVAIALGIASGDVVSSLVGLGPLTLGCLLLAFRLLTFVRFRRKLAEGNTKSPVLVGTAESFLGRLRSVRLDQQELVTVEASALGRPQAFGHIPLREVSAVEEPEWGSVRLITAAGGSFWLRRGNANDAKELARQVELSLRE